MKPVTSLTLLVQSMRHCESRRQVLWIDASDRNYYSVLEDFDRNTYYPLRRQLRSLCGQLGHFYAGPGDPQDLRRRCDTCGMTEGVQP